MPFEVVRDFLDLVHAVENLLDEVIEPVRTRLIEILLDADRVALVKEGTMPTVRELPAAEFSGSSNEGVAAWCPLVARR